MHELLLKRLADGHFHSGEELASDLGLSRSAVWKQLKKLENLDITIDAVRGRGYRWAQAIPLLAEMDIFQALTETSRTRISAMEVHLELPSTNQYLMEKMRSGRIEPGHVCLAERQTNGRGRRGKTWISPMCGNVYLSLSWQFQSSPAALGGLSLAIGVAVIRALSAMGIRNLGLKWPNDIYANHRKLAGILLEMQGEAQGPCQVVIGLGINVRMPQVLGQAIEQDWVDLHSLLPGITEQRNALVASLLNQIVQVVQEYDQQGFAATQQEWQQLDVTYGNMIEIHLPQEKVVGKACGIDQDGALLLECNGSMQRYTIGDVSVRLPA